VGKASILDLVEQALPLRALVVVALELVELPVAAEDQEGEHLYAKDDGSRRQRSGEVCNALVFLVVRSARV
jgi:hypothetical protein